MLFGFKNAGAVYSRLIQKLEDILGILAHLDDVLLHTNYIISHVKLLDLVFRHTEQLELNWMQIKHFFFRTEV